MYGLDSKPLLSNLANNHETQSICTNNSLLADNQHYQHEIYSSELIFRKYLLK